MGKKSGKPGPDPRLPIEREALHPFGGPQRPPLDEVKSREKKALDDFGRKVRGGK